MLAFPISLWASAVTFCGLWLVMELTYLRDLPSLSPRRDLYVNDFVIKHERVILEQTKAIGNEAVGYRPVTLAESLVNVLSANDDVDTESSESTNIEQPINLDEDLEINLDTPPRVSPRIGSGKRVVPHAPKPPKYSDSESFSLEWEYGMKDKLQPYVGNKHWMNKFAKDSRHYLNSLATFPYPENSGQLVRMHGHLGVWPNGTEAWLPTETPPAITDPSVNATHALLRGGFYLKLSNAIPLDRPVIDFREKVCTKGGWDYASLPDASVVITFYNEPLSTLLRSVHSVLNNTPPSLLREIILVDDHSNLPENRAGDDLDEYVKLLPKTKILRLPERRGLVWARLAGAQASKGDVLVVLDSHIEVNEGWLEPQLNRIKESPKSIVFPQIMAINPETFEAHNHAGIGCWLSWKWNMVEQSTFHSNYSSENPVPSASMAGGLFAVKLDWFWELGGYDELFSMWGCENVEMGFRTWMCGGRLECLPCALTYHIYRKGGVGYKSPSGLIKRNRKRTARLWMDEHWMIARHYMDADVDMGEVDHILELKERLQCKPFSWFLKNVDPDHDIQNLEDVQFYGAIKNVKTNQCVDMLNNGEGKPFGMFGCHGHMGGNQSFLKDKTKTYIRNGGNESVCLSRSEKNEPLIAHCTWEESKIWTYLPETQQFKTKPSHKCVENCVDLCLEVGEQTSVKFEPCDETKDSQKWVYDDWVRDTDYEPLDYSIKYKKEHGLLDEQAIAETEMQLDPGDVTIRHVDATEGVAVRTLALETDPMPAVPEPPKPGEITGIPLN